MPWQRDLCRCNLSVKCRKKDDVSFFSLQSRRNGIFYLNEAAMDAIGHSYGGFYSLTFQGHLNVIARSNKGNLRIIVMLRSLGIQKSISSGFRGTLLVHIDF